MEFGFVNSNNMAMLTDLYELTMAQVYFDEKMQKRAVFDFYIRPTKRRNYFLNAGLEGLLYYLENIHFSDEDIAYLRQTGKFSEPFLSYLANFRFQGDLYGMDEGEIFFANEPVVQIEASLIEAQIIETFLINTMQLPIMVATKAMRCTSVGRGTKMVDFGLRRAHGTDAGMKAARSAYIGGFLGSSNVLAGELFAIPIFGTMAHSFILAHETEEEAFAAFAKAYPDDAILLVDTFDTIEGVAHAIETIKKLGMKHFKGIRLDSGDVKRLAKRAREMLDEAGFEDAMILVSGGVDEYMVDELLRSGAPIDAWGIGTKLVVSDDLPFLDCAYKLVELDGQPKMKFSPAKVTLPHKKQIYRTYKDGLIHSDEITLFDERRDATPLLHHYMHEGKVIRELPTLEQIRKKAKENFEKLPHSLRDIHTFATIEPRLSPKIQEVVKRLRLHYLA